MIPSKRLKLQGTIEKFKDVVIQGSSGASYTPVFPMRQMLDSALNWQYWGSFYIQVKKEEIDGREYFCMKRFASGGAQNMYVSFYYDNISSIPFNASKLWYKKIRVGYRRYENGIGYSKLLEGSLNNFVISSSPLGSNSYRPHQIRFEHQPLEKLVQQVSLNNQLINGEIKFFDIDEVGLPEATDLQQSSGRYCSFISSSTVDYFNNNDSKTLELLIAYDSEIGLYEETGGAPTSPIISDITKSMFIGNVALYDYFTAEEQQALVDYLKEYYFDKYVVYKDIQDLYDRMKSINTKALYNLALSLEKIKTLYTLDYKQMRKTTKDNDKTHSGSVAIDRTEDVTGNTDMKRADNPSNITGDLVDTYTTEQERNASTQNRINDEDTITSATDTEDDITTEEGNLIDKYMEFASKLDDIENPFITYAKSFKNLFLSYDPTETDEYEDEILTDDSYFY